MTPTERDTLSELLERVRAAEKRDSVLDADLFDVLARPPHGWNRDNYSHVGGPVYWTRDSSSPQYAPRYTASIDAALALVEAKLPGDTWRWHMWNRAYINGEYQGDGLVMFTVEHPLSSGGGPHWHGIRPTLPLAILAALLTALLEGHGHG